ncbi:MAG TPA: DUF5666 domain-containing protein [Vicinamibacteria bacterium]|nr:DUF5666 domain-containing protein [Vicinamibacteria bacterium]
MTERSRSFLLFLAAGATLAAVACGGGSSTVTSSSSVAPPESPVAVAPAPQAGATIAGTVQSGRAASSDVGASSVKGLRVSVTGTSLQSVTDGAGRFTLTGVPAGRAELHFEGSGVDARLTLDGLQNGKTRSVTVSVSGSSCSVVGENEDDDEGEVELKGKVDSVGASSLVVAGKTVRVDASTRLLDEKGKAIPLSGFAPGDFVEVEGTAETGGTILAKKIKLEREDDDDDMEQEVEFTGTISTLSPLVIGGRTVQTDGNTRYSGHKHETLTSAQVLKVGNKVEVEGVKQSDGSVLAKKIQLED